ncbi:MAG TPA: hypothetical protein VGN17_28385 [Bryobacteraceae bacterium]
MIHIDIDDLEDELPAGWEKRAKDALAAVRKVKAALRSAEIDKHSNVWQDPDLKEALQKLSKFKCWYCESNENRSDNAIDHFRPKNNVLEAPTHGGYWWLAFHWENYRFTCTFCNSRRTDKKSGKSGGKHDHFPLVDEKKRAYRASQVERERPELLDPTKNTDPHLIWFEPDGRARPLHDKSKKIPFSRADVSINLYNLNEARTLRRRRALYRTVRRLVKAGQKSYAKFLNGAADAEDAIEIVLGELRAKMKPGAEFSSAARSYVMVYSREPQYEWLEALFRVPSA